MRTDFIFQQDLAPAHAAKSTKDWFTKKQLEVLAWPANSPDLNVIENLWAIVKRKIRDRKPTTLDQLNNAHVIPFVQGYYGTRTQAFSV
uniref:Tc1-like transposase DDE domain-containing protein n=1 Tax=Astyanax mexicanus TaxID=7994 RepID=A0A3B1JZ19_ASTMX